MWVEKKKRALGRGGESSESNISVNTCHGCTCSEGCSGPKLRISLSPRHTACAATRMAIPLKVTFDAFSLMFSPCSVRVALRGMAGLPVPNLARGALRGIAGLPVSNLMRL